MVRCEFSGVKLDFFQRGQVRIFFQQFLPSDYSYNLSIIATYHGSKTLTLPWSYNSIFIGGGKHKMKHGRGW